MTWDWLQPWNCPHRINGRPLRSVLNCFSCAAKDELNQFEAGGIAPPAFGFRHTCRPLHNGCRTHEYPCKEGGGDNDR